MAARAFLYTLGCRLNHAETDILAQLLADAGYLLAGRVEDADLCIVNTCTVTREADAKSRKSVRAFIRRNPGAYMVVTGCHAHVRPEAMAAIPGVDLVVGNANKLDITAWLPAVLEKTPGNPRVKRDPIAPKSFRIAPRHAMPSVCRPQIKIQDGCNGHCAFCIVPRARGESRGRPLDDIIAEARHLAEHGAVEIVVTGLNVGAYACEGKRLVDVLDGIAGVESIRRIRIGSIELSGIGDELIARMADPNHPLVPFLHIPLQSGSETVLARMGRSYRAGEFLAWIERIAARVPDVCLGTDVLVGFPGETEAEFDETGRFLENAPLAYAHVFKYSDREGTPAAHLPDKIDAVTLRDRGEHIRAVSDAKWTAFMQSFLGRTLGVLFETKENGFWTGYTANYIPVFAESGEDRANRLVPVCLERIQDGRMIGCG